ncbi:hypothetical protein MWU75_00090 [Ornithinimicrobium sp. F0845]|uniref:hypothetical protein n=1 Tax=Ornithinimicrobium sp. F0845 TaxID=2926412 RepID=UPI001FF3B672|nr:hypothetical protein [Ornithinimicrobium sp. F0845]MCK0110548.1 hypothetical protein [Ornithinimicrobium sp. F0845]
MDTSTADVQIQATTQDGTVQTTRAAIKHYTVFRPSTVDQLAATFPPDGRTLLITADRLSDNAVSRLRRHGFSWASRHPLKSGIRGEIRFDDGLLTLRDAGSDNPRPTARHGAGRPGVATGRVLQELLYQGSVTQIGLTKATGISQARVSGILSDLAEEPWLTPIGRKPVTWRVTEPGDLIDHWLGVFRPGKRMSTYWYGLDGIVDQARSSAQALGADTWLSGAVAADMLAPWSVPQRALVYTRSGRDLSRLEFVPSQTLEATLEVVVTQDKAIPPSSSAATIIKRLSRGPQETPLADPLVVLWDLTMSGDIDSHESARRLKSAVVDAVRSTV